MVKKEQPMTFDEVLAQVRELLEREGRISYWALKRRFSLDDDYLEDLKDELIKAKHVARDEAGAVLIWTGGGQQFPVKDLEVRGGAIRGDRRHHARQKGERATVNSLETVAG
jgi:hypothetical protein